MKRNVSVHEYLSSQIAFCGRDQVEIARDMGYAKPNMISMLKTGATKLPLNKVGKMAKAIGADPAFLLRLTIQEYHPGLWESISEILHVEPISANEQAILNVIREANNTDPELDDESRTKLYELALTMPGKSVPQVKRSQPKAS